MHARSPHSQRPAPVSHLGLQQQRTRDGQPLLLAARQRVPPLPHLGLIPTGQLPHKLVSMRCSGRCQDLCRAGPGLAVAAAPVSKGVQARKQQQVRGWCGAVGEGGWQAA